MKIQSFPNPSFGFRPHTSIQHLPVTILVFFLCLVACKKLPQQQVAPEPVVEAKPNPLARFEKQIVGYETSDAASMPDQGVIVFTGSSSVYFWRSLKEDMAPLSVINRGFGGSTIPEVTYYADRIIVPYNPSCIVLYGGDNDIVDPQLTPEGLMESLKSYQAKIQQELPGTKTLFLSIKPSIARKGLLEKAKICNDMVKDYCETDPLMSYVDVFSPMMLSGNKIMSEIFIQDSLHMNAKGYAIWKPIVKKSLEEMCEE